jgi:hypothetical protein
MPVGKGLVAMVAAGLLLTCPPVRAAGTCSVPKGAWATANGQFACIKQQFYRCKQVSGVWQWVYVAPNCPHVDPLPGKSLPAAPPTPG